MSSLLAFTFPANFNYRPAQEILEKVGLRETSVALNRKDLFLYRSMMETNTLEMCKDQDALTDLYKRSRSDGTINYSKSSKKMPISWGKF